MWLITVIYSKLPINFYSKYTLPVRLSIENSQNELLILIGCLVLILKTKFNAEKILRLIGYWALFLSLLAIPFQDRWISGIVVNKSMNAILCIGLLPYIYEPLTAILTLLVVLTSKSSSAYLAFFGVLLIRGVNSKMRGFSTYRLLAYLKMCMGWVLLLASTLIFLKLLDKDIFFAGSRFNGYKFFFNDFHGLEYLFGKGPASFFSISSFRQARELFDFENGYYIWMHSDLLQFIYEYGVLGLIPLFICLYKMLKITKQREFYSLLAFFFGGVFYYPFHFPVHLFVIFLVLKLANGD